MLEKAILQSLELTHRAGASSSTIGSALAGALARFIAQDIEVGHEREFLNEVFVPEVLNFIEQDRRPQTPLN
jgi:hypothetical protein